MRITDQCLVSKMFSYLLGSYLGCKITLPLQELKNIYFDPS